MKLNFPKLHGATPLEKAIRALAMLFVVLLVLWAFTKNNEMVMKRLSQEQALWDETGQITGDEKKYVGGVVRRIKQDFGVQVKVQIFQDIIIVPELDAKILYIGLSPKNRELELRIPGLVRKVLGDAFIDKLKIEQLLPAMEEDQWVWGVQISLDMIYDQLKAIQQGEKGS